MLGCPVQIAHERTCLCTGYAPACVDFDPVHPGEIDHQAAVAHAESDAIMASTPHRQWQIVVLGKVERVRDIIRAGTPHDQCRMQIERAIEDKPGRFVLTCLRRNDTPRDRRS
jgi:hypothetical protein